MHPLLSERLEALEKRRESFVSRVTALPEDSHTAPLGKGEWSPAQLVLHMATAERLYIDWMEGVAREELDRLRPTRSPIYKMLLWVLNKAIKSPPMKEMLPQGNPTLEEAAQAWRHERQRLRTIMEDKTPDQVVLKHPQLKGMSAEQVMEVFEAHATYHEKRLKTLLS